MFRNSLLAMLAVAAWQSPTVSLAQNSAATPWPWMSPSPSAAQINPPPPRDIPLVEKTWEELSDQQLGEDGERALAVKPERWKHAETDHFIIHFRRVTEARKVVREIEYDFWFVAKTLGSKPEQYARKSHVFVFEDENEWRKFLVDSGSPLWIGSFASREGLFLNIRRMEKAGAFDSHTLAHETTHAVIARLYPRKRWPVWLNEGFAEYMSGASIAARSHQPLRKFQRNLEADMSLDEMFAMQRYPDDVGKIHELYRASERFVRFLMDEMPPSRFREYADALLATGDAKTAFMQVYGDKFATFDAFQRKFATFSR